MQLTLPPGTGPLAVGELTWQVTVSTSVPSGCSTVMVAKVSRCLRDAYTLCGHTRPTAACSSAPRRVSFGDLEPDMLV